MSIATGTNKGWIWNCGSARYLADTKVLEQPVQSAAPVKIKI